MLLCAALALLGGAPASADATWFLLEFTRTRPTCTDARPGARCIGTRPESRCVGTRPGARCIGAGPEIARFEIRDEERIEMPTGDEIPPAWAAFDALWVYAPAAASRSLERSIELTATPIGVRLIIQDRGRHFLRSVTLDDWQQLDGDLGSGPPIWVRVTRLTPPASPEPRPDPVPPALPEPRSDPVPPALPEPRPDPVPPATPESPGSPTP